MVSTGSGAAGAERHTAFETSHPVVPFLYFALAIGTAMCSFQPVLVAVSLAAGLAACAFMRGARAVASSLRWQLPALAIVALFNPLFVSAGSTELFRIGTRAVYLESFAYGACMGALMLSCVLWFQAAAQALPFDKVAALLGGGAPVLALMLSMCMRLVPRFVRKGRDIMRVQRAAGRGAGVRGYLRASNVLMAWSMEDSLETADSMRARGWGAVARRSTYVRYRFTRADAAALAGIVVLWAASAACAAVAVGQFSFYPRMSVLVLWWGYVPYAALMFLPCTLCAAEGLSWRRAERGPAHAGM